MSLRKNRLKETKWNEQLLFVPSLRFVWKAQSDIRQTKVPSEIRYEDWFPNAEDCPAGFVEFACQMRECLRVNNVSEGIE
jgi:hypothetical protein